jgi:hypothetical protein
MYAHWFVSRRNAGLTAISHGWAAVGAKAKVTIRSRSVKNIRKFRVHPPAYDWLVIRADGNIMVSWILIFTQFVWLAILCRFLHRPIEPSFSTAGTMPSCRWSNWIYIHLDWECRMISMPVNCAPHRHSAGAWRLRSRSNLIWTFVIVRCRRWGASYRFDVGSFDSLTGFRLLWYMFHSLSHSLP